MSTICKLDPTIRQARFARRGLLTHLTQTMQRTPLNDPRANALISTTQLMHDVIKASNLTGTEKSIFATRIAKDFQKTMRPPVKRIVPQAGKSL